MKTSRFKDNQIIAILKQAEAGVLPFEQRGRRIANEYWMKWYLLVDSIMMNRTDGALVRIITPIYPSEDVAAADQRLQDFLAVALPPLPEYIPN